MFRHQTHPRNAHPYQTTVVPRTDAQFHHSNQQRSKYPWLENPPFHPQECQSTNSSNSENYQITHYTNPRNQWTMRSQSDGLSSPVYHMPYSEHQRLSPPLLAGYSKPYQMAGDVPNYSIPIGVHESDSSTRECPVSVVPARSPVPSEIRAPGGCGGHCPGFEYVCYYVLQIIFVVGILTGVSLCIAGSVLRRSNRGGDLSVLVYIGCLAFMVCSLLLGVQCCVRRSNKQRGKQLRMRTAPPDCIPMDTIANSYMGESPTAPQPQSLAVRQMQPLLFPIPPMSASTLPRNYYRSDERHNARSSPIEEINGVPWWRRQ
ncbi:uncharacterized protein LOC143912778 [Arctopsyche grandis]|uniref:uncharacterized protein LOC143912778 n=1 Tax=Arctopsyche grandis TaxID=121162 RepID=UPI00406D82C4